MMADRHQLEPLHQPPAPADRLDGGQRLPVEIAPASTAHHQQEPASRSQERASTVATAMAWCTRYRVLPGSAACLLAIAAGHDNTTDIGQATGMSGNGVRTAVRRLTGRGRFKNGKVAAGTGQPLISERPHPHRGGNGCRQLQLTPAGRQLVDALLGDPRALVGD